MGWCYRCKTVFNIYKQGEIMLGVRLDEQLENRLSALAAKTKRSKSFLAKEALVRYLEEEERKEKAGTGCAREKYGGERRGGRRD